MNTLLIVLALLVATPADAGSLGNVLNERGSPAYDTSVLDKMSLKEKAFLRILLIEFVYECNGKQSRLMPNLIAAHSKIDAAIVPILSAARSGGEPKSLGQVKAGENAAQASIARNGTALCKPTAEWLTNNIPPSENKN